MLLPPEVLWAERFLLWVEERGAYLADTDGAQAILLEPEQCAELLRQWAAAGLPGPERFEE